MLNKAAVRDCDECGSLFCAGMSKMDALCPECAHALYGYPACVHVFQDGRCLKCFWDGKRSSYLDGLRDS